MLNVNKSNSLVSWTYTPEEWKKFMRWRKMRKGVLYFLLQWLSPAKKTNIPQITISYDEVVINGLPVSFQNKSHHLKRINILDAGRINVLEITYERVTAKQTRLTDIFLPVPKGKLREAIELEEKLLDHYHFSGKTV